LWQAVGSAAAWLRDCLSHLDIDAERMRVNLEATGGLVLAERVSGALAPALGRLRAPDLVAGVCAGAVTSGRPLFDLLAAEPDIRAQLDAHELRRLLDPSGYLGSAGALVDRALTAHADFVRRRAQAPRRPA